MRIASVQFAPLLGQPEKNAEHVRQLLKNKVAGSAIDAGYHFATYDAIAPLLESPYRGEGATYTLATQLAKELHCYVVAGFPERASPEALQDRDLAHGIYDARTPQAELAASSAHRPKLSKQAFNAALLIDRQGRLANVFRKHFLYEADTPWADEGPGFSYVDLPDLGRVCVAVCMDLNPYLLDSDFEKYELAHFCDKHRVDVLVMPMNWLLPEDERESHRTSTTDQPSIATLHYWVARSIPLWVPGMGQPGNEGRRTTLIAANRTGTEHDTVFAGSSSVIRFQTGDQANLLGTAGTRNDAVLVVDV